MHDLQKRNVKRLFDLYDYDNNDVISVDDANNVIRNLAGVRSLEEGTDEFNTFRDGFMIYWNVMTNMIDIDHDRVITEDEWMGFHNTMLADPNLFEQAILASAQFMFELIDVNGDGHLTLEEYGTWMKAYRIDDEHIVDETFKHLDVNGSGELSLGDMNKLIHQFFYSDNADDAGHWCLGIPE